MRVTVIVPTLAADNALQDCLASLRRQTLREFETIVVDNSAGSRADAPGARVLRSGRNIGYGAAINLGVRNSAAPYVAALNDDAVADPRWLEALVGALESSENVGMCASQVLLEDGQRLDSAGMLLYADGTTKQRGHGRPAAEFGEREEALLPSGAAALYRRALLEDLGGFDEDFFLYCEDSDLGLRARWAGWRCLYVPAARVLHRYSHTAGRASSLKAYLVERNRLFLIVKNFPWPMVAAAPFRAVVRYWWHLRGGGAAEEFRRQGSAFLLAWFVVQAHCAAAWRLPALLRKRRAVARRITPTEFSSLMRRFSITAREVAAQ